MIDLRTRWLFARHDIGVAITKLKMEFVWRLPRWIIYFAAIRMVAEATTGDNGHINVGDLNAMDAVKMWDDHTEGKQTS